MIVFTLIVAYFSTCWLAYRLFIEAWTFDTDATRADLHLFVALSFAGPISLLAATGIWLMESADYRNRNRNNEIIYPRKDKS